MIKRIVIIVLTFLLNVLAINAQLLYKISGKDIKKPSYIVGTFHLAQSSFIDSIPGLRAAMEEAEQVCGELVTSEMQQPENIQKMTEAMMLEGGKTVNDIFTPEEMTRLNAFTKSLLTVDFTNPMVMQQLGKMTPMALGQQFSVLMVARRMPGFNPQDLLDDSFQKYALEKQKPVLGLETFDFQVKTLFLGKTLKRQKEVLMCLVDNPEYENLLSDNMIAAYYAKDLQKLYDLVNEKRNNQCDATPEEDDLLFNNRNRDWITKMPAIMAAHSTLFCVGAGHLPGKTGVLQLLKEAGYSVEVVK